MSLVIFGKREVSFHGVCGQGLDLWVAVGVLFCSFLWTDGRFDLHRLHLADIIDIYRRDTTLQHKFNYYTTTTLILFKIKLQSL